MNKFWKFEDIFVEILTVCEKFKDKKVTKTLKLDTNKAAVTESTVIKLQSEL